jgi:hypothetical protein
MTLASLMQITLLEPRRLDRLKPLKRSRLVLDLFWPILDSFSTCSLVQGLQTPPIVLHVDSFLLSYFPNVLYPTFWLTD